MDADDRNLSRSVQRLIAHFEGPALASIAKEGVSRADWGSHFHLCVPCADAVLAYRMAQRGMKADGFACIHMAHRATQTCEQHPDRAECQDLMINYKEKFDEYWIIKTQVSLTIGFCPWCGVKLPPSQHDRWFDELDKIGLYPWSEDVPEVHRTSAWFKRVLKL